MLILHGEKFSYQDMRKVYTIVIFEKSPKSFSKIPDCYIHRGRIVFDSGLEMDFLQEYCLVALDVFRKKPYSEDRNEQAAWLSFLTTETLEDAERLMNKYPWLEEIYKEIAMLRQKPGEVLHMFSEALKIMDRNTVNYMIEEQQKELEEKDKQLEQKNEQLEQKNEQLEQKDKQLQEKDQEILALRRQLEELQSKG